jgi:hypothetical protein
MRMRTRTVLVWLLIAIMSVAAAPRHSAPDALSHNTAMFLATLSGDGHTRVTFKASALGTHFFFEEPAGVTVYFFDGNGYRKQTFMKGATLSAAIKRFR